MCAPAAPRPAAQRHPRRSLAEPAAALPWPSRPAPAAASSCPEWRLLSDGRRTELAQVILTRYWRCTRRGTAFTATCSGGRGPATRASPAPPRSRCPATRLGRHAPGAPGFRLNLSGLGYFSCHCHRGPGLLLSLLPQVSPLLHAHTTPLLA